MRWLLKFLFAVLPLSLCAQLYQQGRYEKGRHKPVLTPDSLARSLTAPYSKDIDKVRAIFNWIAENIEYNTQPWRNAQRFATSLDTYEEDTGALKPLSERVAIDVLNKRVAFCDGYSRLFKTLCDYSGIRCEVITGFADVGLSIRRAKFKSNHRWNAVYIDSSWHLLDVTWASGYVSFGANDYVQHFNDRYFFTPPAVFFRDHYPEEHQWALLPQLPSMSEYRFSPFKTNAFVRKRIESYKPASGLIQAAVGDTIQFELETSGEDKRLLVLDTAFVDSAVIAAAMQTDTVYNKFSFTGNKINFYYIVTSPAAEWLHIVLNDEVVMRYRLEHKKGCDSGKISSYKRAIASCCHSCSKDIAGLFLPALLYQ